MAAPIKTCEFCFKTIKDKSYRSLTSNTSQEQYGNIFNKLGIASVNGFVCNQCVNKLNRVNKLNGDIRTKVLMLTQERDKVLDTLKQMPGIVKQHQDMSTPKRGEKRHLVKQTPTPKSRLKKSLFQTPTRRTSTSTCIPAQDSPAKTCTSKMDRSTQTKQTREDFDVKVKYIIFFGVNLARFFTESIYTCG